MIALRDPFVIRRILVALDASTHDLAALDAAVDLAERVKAEIEGLFIEDINLMRLAEFPFAQQLGLPTGLRLRLDAEVIEREMRALAEEARRTLEAAAARSEVRWSFRVVRGPVEVEMRAAAGGADLIVLDTASRPLTRHARLGSPAEGAARRSALPVLLLRGRPGPVRSVVVAFDGSAGAAKALAAAAEIAVALAADGEPEQRVPLWVLCLADCEAAARTVERKARDLLARHEVAAQLETMIKAGPARLCEAVRAVEDGLFVLDAGAPLLDKMTAEGLLAETDCPLLLVR